MSSLFPERNLTSGASRELALITGLTELQKKQLSSTTGAFMREHGLIGYENTKLVMPVIKQCILDGLRLFKERETILPSDDLSIAFKRGYGARSGPIDSVQEELEKLNGEGDFAGELAIPQQIVRVASREIEQRAFLVDLSGIKALDGIAQARRPIFNTLVEFSKDKVEEAIPGSREIELTAKQKAGLVRHLVFSWLTFGELRMILETEDFMLHKEEFLKELLTGDDVHLRELATLVGIDSVEGVKYLSDLATQIGDFVKRLPNAPRPSENPLEIALKIGNAFRVLESEFLVVNPFDKYPHLSEDINDRGKSIWDDNRVSIVNIEGVTYRVPNPSTLKLASIMLVNSKNDRAMQLLDGSRVVSGLFAFIERQRADLTIPNLEHAIARDEKVLADMNTDIIAGKVPARGRMSSVELRKLVNKQLMSIHRDRVFLDLVRKYHSGLVELGVTLVKRYLAGEPATGVAVYEGLRIFDKSPQVLHSEVRNFIRTRVKQKLLDGEQAFACTDFVSAMISQTRADLKERFQEAFGATVIDLLEARSRFWLNTFLSPIPNLEDSQREIVADAIYIQEERRILSEIRRKSGEFSPTKREVDRETEKILANASHPLTLQLREIRQTRDSGLLSEATIFERLFSEYIKFWHKEGEDRARRAILGWANTQNITYKLDDGLSGWDRMVRAKPLKVKEEDSPSQGAEAALKIVILTLVRLAPRELWPTDPVNIESLVHGGEISVPTIDKRRDELERGRERFKGWLEDRGVTFENDLKFFELVTLDKIPELLENGHWLNQLFGMEQELNSWYDFQITRLVEQQQSYNGHIYRIPVKDVISPVAKSIASKKMRLAAIRMGGIQALNQRISQLRTSRLVKIEPQ